MEQRMFNFSAGPATLPLPVLKKAQEELVLYPGAGASVMEISHRSKAYDAIHAQAKQNIASLLDLTDAYQVMFLQGGASLQFSMIAMNFLAGQSADYIHTGSWASKAISEAKKHGEVKVAWNGKEENFVRVPRNDELKLDPNAAYVHFTSNETIQGVEYPVPPEVGGKPLFCDFSSSFLSGPVDVSKFSLIYAGAQKNVGPSGVVVVIVRKDLLERVPQGLPSMLDYRLMAENDSLYNTPPCFSVYIVGLVTSWLLEDMGGLEKVKAHNQKKAQLLYFAIDGSGGFYRGHAQKDSRSLMNVTFRLPEEALEKEFIGQATAQGLDGLKGHRSVGGCRASIYNAMPLEGCQALRDFMVEFQKKKG
ncbi:MAG: 3-phosphoserine/phosphohydroxythreonine transaminase [Candidatus Hydrogenedentes bacterium]|nr:3-phosphoserine/phosphohydroxythreonine transaminase [Candidatus Hydrogenedentota bacterium]